MITQEEGTTILALNWVNSMIETNILQWGDIFDWFIEGTIYEMFNALFYAAIPITLLLWAFSFLKMFKYTSDKSHAEKLEVFLVAILFTLATGEGILRFIISGSLQAIQWDLDYRSWALLIIGWLYLIIIVEALGVVFQDIKTEKVFSNLKIAPITPTYFYLGLTIAFILSWLIGRMILGIGACMLILNLTYAISLILIVTITLPRKFAPNTFFNWFFILVMLFSALIVYPGLFADPPMIDTQVYVTLRNQIIILGLEAAGLFLLMNYFSNSENQQPESPDVKT